MAVLLFSATKAILTRLLFFVHCILAIWRTVYVYDDARFWIISGALVCLCVETGVTLKKKRGGEWKWFCPSFFLYLLGVVPAIWFLEMDRLDNWRAGNGTAIINNVTSDQISVGFRGISIEIPVTIDNDTWVNTIEQTMLLLLILGRWLLPKGDITRDQLSQLLFVYIGMASDIMELHTLFEERPVLNDDLLAHCILAVWALSLLQFTLVLTATKENKSRPVTDRGSKGRSYKMAVTEDDPGYCETGCCESEVWSILIMVFFQDGPFLAVRLYSLLTYHIISYSIIFFTSKNVLVILLQFYRLLVIGKKSGKVDPAQQQEPRPGSEAASQIPVRETVPESSPEPVVFLDVSHAKNHPPANIV